MKIIAPLAATAALLAACSGSDDTASGPGTGAEEQAQGPAVASSEAPRNEAIDTDAGGETGQTPGASSFTEDQAREAFEKAGYTGLTQVMQDDQGLWTATGTRNGQSVQVSMDYRGTVVAR